MSQRARTSVVAALLAFLLIFVLSRATSSSQAAQAEPDAAAQFLTGPTDGAPLDIALDYIHKYKTALGLTSADLVELLVTDHYMSQHNGVSHIYLRQRYQGIEVHGANMNINIAGDGSVINLGNRFVPNLSLAVNTTKPTITPAEAVNSAASILGLAATQPLSVLEGGPETDDLVLSSGGISHEPIPVRLVYQPVAEDDVRLSWDLEIDQIDAHHHWSMRVDAQTGQVLSQIDFVDQDNWGQSASKVAAPIAPAVLAQGAENLAPDQYRVYALPLESPNHTSPLPPSDSRTLEVNPADGASSPFGWHDTDGVAGPEFTDTRGNNVDAYTDVDANNVPDTGSRPSGGGSLNFDFPVDLTQAPNAYRPAAVTNLFYWNNVIHDVLYHYGFNEASGNFQVNNYGNGGFGNDDVRAEAQDGSGNCNANFLTLEDGSRPRMQMYTCTNASPARDGDLDNGVIVHEYGHGLSNRLTGGPSNVSCLSNGEQPGEGWSDWLALMMTVNNGDSGTDARGIGTYLMGQAADGPGIRQYRYSTNMAVNPHTYDDIILNTTHGRGSVWAAMLWEVTWNLIEAYGFDPDFYNGTGGNNMAMQLIIDGMTYQPCLPGFVDARDGILTADQINNGGANQCRIWEAFAKRGLGFSADQGSSSSANDGAEAFDLPTECLQTLKITKTADPDPVEAGTNLTYSLLVENDTFGSLTGVTATDDVPANTTYVPGSATCGGGESGGTVTFPIGAMNSGASTTCTFEVTVDASAASPVRFADDMEVWGGNWTVSGTGPGGWSLVTTNPHSPVSSFFAPDVTSDSDHYLTLASPVNIDNDTVLRFWHAYDTEPTWDGGVVEISTNGGSTWLDLGPDMIANGYNSTISTNSSSPLFGRQAYSGSSGDYLETLVDLAGYAGNSILIRFRLATDVTVGGDGWYVDDVEILDNGIINNTACVTANEGDNDCDTIHTSIAPSTTPIPPDIDVAPTTLSETLEPDGTSNQILTIDNLGDLDLNWTLEEDDNADCSSPSDNVSWLNESTAGETTGGGGSHQVTVAFDATGLADGTTHSAALCISSNDPDEPLVTVPVDLTVETPLPFLIQLAEGQIIVEGTVEGSYQLTHNDDDTSQVMTEAPRTRGNASKRRDSGEFIWFFPIEHGNNVSFFADARISIVGDGDNFDFSYSTDDVTYYPMFTLSSTTPGNVEMASLSNVTPNDSMVYIKAVDTDSTAGNNAPDSFSIDYMYVMETTGSSGNTPPTAAFSYSASQLEVTFTDASSDPDDGDGIASWAWDFDDGTPVSTIQNPVHTYDCSGTYLVNLTVTDIYGASDSVTQSVTVSDSGPTCITVDSLTPSSTSQGKTWTAFVDIHVVDDLGAAVQGAIVYGHFTAGNNASIIVSCMTGSDPSGACRLTNDGGVRKSVSSVDFVVDDVDGTSPYVATMTTATIFKP